MAHAEQSSPAAPSADVVGESRHARDNRYVVVARRYRPRSFDELVGQQHVGQALCNAIETGRVGHAYLFTGARGVGKTSTARIFAKALNDPGGPTANPHNDSDIAQAIDAGEDVDVLEIDGASNRGIDEIRSLRAGVGVRPSRSRYKIYIIDEVHMLTGAAFNALLKTLEEPPPHVKFIFCTTDPEKLPITVLSRCQRFDFAPVQTESILGRLREIVDAEGVKADEEALRLIARRADGSMRDSQSLLEQVMSFSGSELTLQTVHAMLGTADDARLHELAQTFAAGDAAAALALVDRACGEGVAAGQLAEQLLGYFRDLLTATVGCSAEMHRHTGEGLHEELRQLGQQWGLQTVLAIVGMIDHTLSRIRHSLHGRVLLEASVVQICHLPNLQQVADLASALERQPSGGRGGTGSAAPARQVPAVGDEKKKHEPLSGEPDRAATPAGRGLATAARAPTALTATALTATALAHATPAHATTPGQQPAKAALSTGAAVASARTDPAAPVVKPVGNGLASAASPVAAPRPPVANGDSSRPPHLAGSASATQLGVGDRGGSGPGQQAEPAPQPKSRAQRMREIENHPYVKSCVEIFAAEIVRIDSPRGGDAARRG